MIFLSAMWMISGSCLCGRGKRDIRWRGQAFLSYFDVKHDQWDRTLHCSYNYGCIRIYGIRLLCFLDVPGRLGFRLWDGGRPFALFLSLTNTLERTWRDRQGQTTHSLDLHVCLKGIAIFSLSVYVGRRSHLRSCCRDWPGIPGPVFIWRQWKIQIRSQQFGEKKALHVISSTVSFHTTLCRPSKDTTRTHERCCGKLITKVQWTCSGDLLPHVHIHRSRFKRLMVRRKDVVSHCYWSSLNTPQSFVLVFLTIFSCLECTSSLSN